MVHKSLPEEQDFLLIATSNKPESAKTALLFGLNQFFEGLASDDLLLETYFKHFLYEDF